MNKDNVISLVPRIAIVTKNSPRTGNDYTQLQVHFDNGKSQYVYSGLLTNEQKTLIQMLIDNRERSDDTLLDD